MAFFFIQGVPRNMTVGKSSQTVMFRGTPCILIKWIISDGGTLECKIVNRQKTLNVVYEVSSSVGNPVIKLSMYSK